MIKKITLSIGGMHCTSCSLNLGKDLAGHAGITEAKVNFATGKAEICYDEEMIDIAMIKKIVASAGYTASDGRSEEKKEAEKKAENHQKINLILSAILTLPIFIRMFWMWEIEGSSFGISHTNLLLFFFSAIIVFIFGLQFHKNAFLSLKKEQLNMDTLISMGTLSAFFYSSWAMTVSGQHIYFDSAAGITTLILLGKYLELKTKNRAGQAMEKLLELGVKKARVVVDGTEAEKDIEAVSVGEIISIKPGEKIPLDAEITEGVASIEESMLTGESLPVTKSVSESIFAATINLNGLIKARVTKTSEESMLSQIIKTVEEAQNFKAPIQKLADKISSIFVPAVIFLAIATFIGWFLATGEVAKSLINAVTVLIISCPCALGLATPIAIMVGTNMGAKDGILIKNGEAFEKAKNINVAIFDKTGTLTLGKPIVERMIANEEAGFADGQLLKIGRSIATLSLHPISQAISLLGEEKSATIVPLENFSENSGLGVTAICATHRKELALGNIKLMRMQGVDISWADRILKGDNTDKTIVFVAHGSQIAGAFFIGDKIREGAGTAIASLKSMGFKTMLLSGDNRKSAEVVAKNLGIDETVADVLPHEKSAKIKEIQEDGNRVVFIGDGINDAPSLVQADLGIAMGSGSDIAKESGDIVIMQNNPLKVVEAIRLSRKTFSIIKQNLFWAFFYNSLAIPLAMAGLVNPMVGALAMGFSDLSIILNSLRILRK